MLDKGFTSTFLSFMKELERNKRCCLDFLTNKNLKIDSIELLYKNDADVFQIGSGFGYGNLSTLENFSVSSGISYTHITGANFAISTIGQVTINLPSSIPTAFLEICPGLSTPGGAPIKLINGSLLATPENGVFEFDGFHLYFTIGTTRTVLI